MAHECRSARPFGPHPSKIARLPGMHAIASDGSDVQDVIIGSPVGCSLLLWRAIQLLAPVATSPSATHSARPFARRILPCSPRNTGRSPKRRPQQRAATTAASLRRPSWLISTMQRGSRTGPHPIHSRAPFLLSGIRRVYTRWTTQKQSSIRSFLLSDFVLTGTVLLNDAELDVLSLSFCMSMDFPD